MLLTLHFQSTTCTIWCCCPTALPWERRPEGDTQWQVSIRHGGRNLPYCLLKVSQRLKECSNGRSGLSTVLLFGEVEVARAL